MAGLARSMVWGLAMSVGVSIMVGVLTSGGHWPTVAVNGLIALMYSFAIGAPAMLIFRRLRLRLDARAPLRPWLGYVAVLLAITLAGTFVVRGGLTLGGLMTPQAMWSGLRLSLLISLAIALPMTIGAVTYSRLQQQLDVSALAAERALTVASEARLASLESRIRPHFLFNALNSAVALIPIAPKRAEDVLVRLGALLRRSLDTRAHHVTLADELQVVTDYLEIERARFGDRLAYTIEVAAGVDTIRLPAFAVQTLVENSVKHAVAVREDRVTIAVRGRREGHRLVVEVTDDGPGLTGSPWLAGHGLDSLRARLEVVYGGAATLAIEGAGAAGVAVTLELPDAPP